MPVYEFKCQDQGCFDYTKTKSRQLKISEYDEPQYCEGCGKQLQRLPPQSTVFVLKGSGWFKKGGY
jgi:putative FmdB family regulatory protein